MRGTSCHTCCWVMTACVLVELVLVFAGMDGTVAFKLLLWNLFAISYMCYNVLVYLNAHGKLKF